MKPVHLNSSSPELPVSHFLPQCVWARWEVLWMWQGKDGIQRKRKWKSYSFHPWRFGGREDKMGKRGGNNMWGLTLLPQARVQGDVWMDVCGGSTVRSRQKLVAEEILMRGPVWGSWRRQRSRMKHNLGFQAAGKRESLSEALEP